MGRRGGFGSVIRAIARDAARQHRAAVAAHNRTVREAHRQQVAAARQSARDLAAYGRQAKLNYIASREKEAEQLNRDEASRLEELDGMLAATLSVNDAIAFDSLRLQENAPRLALPEAHLHETPEPQEYDYLNQVRPPSFIGRLIPGSAKRQKVAQDEAMQRYRNDHEKWSRYRQERQRKIDSHERDLNAFREKKSLRDREVDEFQTTYQTGDPESIVAYVSLVLERSVYPDDFPQHFSVAYSAASKQLIVEYELPPPSVVPVETVFRYIKTRDEITNRERKASDIKTIYANLIASVALRTLHEVFESDTGNHVAVCVFNGYVHTVDPATGRDIQPHLISVRATKTPFLEIDLARVDKTICLKNLGAKLSSGPMEAQPVRPIVEFAMADARFVDQHDLASKLSAATNLMELNPFEFEQLVANLFTKMGLEAKLTRSSRDGGVDCIAYDARPILGGQVVIQAKRYRHTVGVSAVRDLYGTMQHEGANKGILVTTSGYGSDAYEFAKDKPIELVDGGGLLYLLQEIGVEARIVMPEGE